MGVSILCAKLLKEMLVPMSLLLFFVCFEASAIEIVVGKKPGVSISKAARRRLEEVGG